jgi:F0F1-type ATP synthase delta subunit
MIMNNRMKILNQVIDCIEKDLNAKKGIKNLEVKTSLDIDVETKQQIESDLEKAFNSKIEAEFVTDQSILGGFIAHSDSEILDLSVKRRFDEIRRAFNIS